MSQIYAKLPGLDREKLLAIVEPILRAHGVCGVELIWRGDGKGQVLELTVERALPAVENLPPGIAAVPGAGVTIDICSEISRDLSAALDVSDVIALSRYRLEVGSPGLDRALHFAADYQRFAGQLARIKLLDPLQQEGFVGQKVVRGTLAGLVPGVAIPASSAEGGVAEAGVAEGGPAKARDAGDRVVVETEAGRLELPVAGIASARLIFQWKSSAESSGRKERLTGGKKPRSKRSK